MSTVVLLTISNIFMTFAWYGHLKYRHAPLFKVILISWVIAFAEYCFQVPANRIGSYEFTAAQLKTIQDGDHVKRVFGILGSVPKGTNPVELCCRICNDCRRRC